ncbi:MlaD family protein [Gluconacetobacter entanii]|uniref:MlaD family protein n=1 Tax=Gluconacetobacter entanii TaxID=108528 RepID=A0A318PWS0_9PROT|nr:MlaD family protein [Gluconacetobacter entanii]MBE7620581.1 MCE family protein [Komagataeibacter sp. FXV2]MCE2579190.1 MlaD family protein [Komagataeibacter sp. FNDCR1]MBY4640919.1 MlaD family protein [Gluconacetobacter entanii]MCW4580538.1 MlaD family protein [Gluconacetobacter entanii]MCW4583841.1 MlaD family protein [Gluconacetobacter entanii]
MAERQTTVGAFVLGGALLGVAAVVLFGKFHPFSATNNAVVIFDGAINGLGIGAPVTLEGVQVGTVEKIGIKFDPASHKAYIPVTVQLRADRTKSTEHSQGLTAEGLPDLIRHGLRAELHMQSFVTGQEEIDLSFDPATPAQLHPGISDLTEIPVRESEMQKLTDTLTTLPLKTIATNADEMLVSIRSLADRLDKDLPPLVTSVKETSDRSRVTVDTATDTIRDLDKRLDVTLASIDRLANSGTQQLDSRGAELHDLLLNSNNTVTEARQTLAGLHDITAPSSADRANLDSSLRDLAAAASALRGFATDVERNPQLLLMGRRN